jgi:hypothetical protein
MFTERQRTRPILEGSNYVDKEINLEELTYMLLEYIHTYITLTL